MAEKEIIQNINNYISSRAPEFLNTLNKMCIKHYDKDCATLFVIEPDKLRKILMRYNDENTVRFVIKNLFLKPLLKKLGREELIEELTNYFINDIEKFKEKLMK